MPKEGEEPRDESIIENVSRTQVAHFIESDPRCRAMQLPDGVQLRYTLSTQLYFYLRTGIKDGKIHTRLFASDSPYDREKTPIGEVGTPIFEHQAEVVHLKKIEQTLRRWVTFVGDTGDSLEEFKSFEVGNTRGE